MVRYIAPYMSISLCAPSTEFILSKIERAQDVVCALCDYISSVVVRIWLVG